LFQKEVNKGLTLLNEPVKRVNVTPAVSVGFSEVDEIERVEINARDSLGDVGGEVTGIPSIAVEAVHEDEDGLRRGGGLGVVVV
jgi:hypothetical protein